MALSDPSFKQFPAKWVCSTALRQRAQPPFVRGTVAMSHESHSVLPFQPRGVISAFLL